MSTVKINNKKYEVPKLGFGEYTKMEEQGFSILDAFRKQQTMLLSMGFVCVVTNHDRDSAESLLEQHVMGGGNILDIYTSFMEAVSDSGFFQKMLGIKENETPRKTATTTIKKETETVNE